MFPEAMGLFARMSKTLTANEQIKLPTVLTQQAKNGNKHEQSPEKVNINIRTLYIHNS